MVAFFFSFLQVSRSEFHSFVEREKKSESIKKLRFFLVFFFFFFFFSNHALPRHALCGDGRRCHDGDGGSFRIEAQGARAGSAASSTARRFRIRSRRRRRRRQSRTPRRCCFRLQALRPRAGKDQNGSRCRSHRSSRKKKAQGVQFHGGKRRRKKQRRRRRSARWPKRRKERENLLEKTTLILLFLPLFLPFSYPFPGLQRRV